MPKLLDRLKQWSQHLKLEMTALFLAYQDPRVSRHARIFVAAVIGYALSPIDLIPDFIPVLGYLDDIILIPLGIWLALKMIPPEVLAECRKKARESAPGISRWNRTAAVVIVATWIALASLMVNWLFI